MRYLAGLLLALPLLAAPHELAPAVPIPSAYLSGEPQVASNGDGFLAVWRYDTIGNGLHLFAARLDAEGKRLGDAFPLFPYTALPRVQLFAAGGDYAVLTDRRLSIVSAAGEIRRSFDVPAHGLGAANGNRILIVGESAPNSGVYDEGTLFDGEGHVVREHIHFSGGATDVDAYRDGFVVTLMTGTRIDQRRLAMDGAFDGAAIQIGTAATPTARTAVRDDEALVVWVGGLSAARQQLEGTLVRADGTAERLGTMLTDFASYFGLDVAVGEKGYGVVFTATPQPTQNPESARFYALATDVHGHRSRPPQLIAREGDTAPSIRLASVASNGRTFYAVAQTRLAADGMPQTGGAAFRVGAEGLEDVRPDNLSNTPTRQTSPAVATNGVDFFAAWIDNSALGHFLDAQLLTRDGARIGETLSGGQAGLSGRASVAYGNGVYLAVWTETPPNGQRLVARRFSPSGALLEAAPIVLHNAEISETTVTWNGRQFYAVWGERDRIWGVIIHSDGTAEPPRQVGPEPLGSDTSRHFQSAPDVAWDGERYVVVWHLLRLPSCVTYCGASSEIRGAFVSERNLPLETTDFLLASDALRPHIVRGGRALLLTYDTNEGVFGKFLDGKTFPIFRWNAQTFSNVTWDGRSYVAAWRYPIVAGGVVSKGLTALGAARIDETGFVEPYVYAPVGTSEGLEGSPDLISNETGDTMMRIFPDRRRSAHSPSRSPSSHPRPLPPPPHGI